MAEINSKDREEPKTERGSWKRYIKRAIGGVLASAAIASAAFIGPEKATSDREGAPDRASGVSAAPAAALTPEAPRLPEIEVFTYAGSGCETAVAGLYRALQENKVLYMPGWTSMVNQNGQHRYEFQNSPIGLTEDDGICVGHYVEVADTRTTPRTRHPRIVSAFMRRASRYAASTPGIAAA